MENYSNLLRQHQLKATPQRIEIVALLSQYGHLSIDQLYDFLKQKFQSLSLATIYKNIHIMMENAFITEVKIPEQKSVYELTKEAHSHMVCLKCHKIEDIHIDLFDVVNETRSKTTFSIQNAYLVFDGICSECQKST